MNLRVLCGYWGLSESNGIVFDYGMLEELGIVVVGEVSAIMRAATFLASQRRAGYE